MGLRRRRVLSGFLVEVETLLLVVDLERVEGAAGYHWVEEAVGISLVGEEEGGIMFRCKGEEEIRGTAVDTGDRSPE
jgi:hypothetical protein